MGSSYSIQYVREPGGPSRLEVQEAVEAILRDVDEHYSTYRGDSAVSRFNQLQAGQCQALGKDMLALVGFGQQLAEQSQGAFDLTVEPLLDLWGFGPQARQSRCLTRCSWPRPVSASAITTCASMATSCARALQWNWISTVSPQATPWT